MSTASVDRPSSPHCLDSDPKTEAPCSGGLDSLSLVTSNTGPAELDVPDGGLVAWGQVLAGGLINMLAWGFPAAFGVYQLYYTEALNLPKSQVAWIGSVQVFLTNLMCAPAGRLVDAGYVRATLLGGAALAIFGTFMTSLCTQYWQIMLSQGICTGLGHGIMFMSPIATISSYFKEKRAMALAIAAAGTGAGSVVIPACVQYLIPKIGFPWAVRVTGCIAIFNVAVSTLLLKPRLRPRKSGPWVEWDAFKESSYALYTLGAFLIFWSIYIALFYINSYARNIVHFSSTDSVQLLLITNGASIISRIAIGVVADRSIGPINTYIISTLVLSCIFFAWIGVTSRTETYIFCVFLGLVTGAAQGIYVGSLASLTTDPRKMGTRFGMVCTIVAFAVLSGPPIAGAIVDKSGGSYLGAQLWAGITMLIGTAVVVLARWRYTGMHLRVKI